MMSRTMVSSSATAGHPAIATVVILEAKDLVAGLDGRARRQLDHDEQQIVMVRRFDGSKKSTP